MANERDVVVDRTRRFLDDLAALARDLTTTPERDVRKALADSPLIWPERVPSHHHDVVLGPGEEREAWLVVRKVQEPRRPELPALLAEAVDPDWSDDLVRGPRLREVDSATADPQTDPSDPDEDPRPAALDDWTLQEWSPWAAKAAPARAARSLYADLFGLHLMLQANQATHELAWGHSVLGWKVESETVLSPMLTTPNDDHHRRERWQHQPDARTPV